MLYGIAMVLLVVVVPARRRRRLCAVPWLLLVRRTRFSQALSNGLQVRLERALRGAALVAQFVDRRVPRAFARANEPAVVGPLDYPHHLNNGVFFLTHYSATVG